MVEPVKDGQPFRGPFELHVTNSYRCPRCGSLPGDPCIDVRVHRARKMMDPGFRKREKERSAERELPPYMQR